MLIFIHIGTAGTPLILAQVRSLQPTIFRCIFLCLVSIPGLILLCLVTILGLARATAGRSNCLESKWLASLTKAVPMLPIGLDYTFLKPGGIANGATGEEKLFTHILCWSRPDILP
jgi:hypothetical protein